MLLRQAQQAADEVDRFDPSGSPEDRKKLVALEEAQQKACDELISFVQRRGEGVRALLTNQTIVKRPGSL